MGSLLSPILSNLAYDILFIFLIIYFHSSFYIRETIALSYTKIIGVKQGIWCYSALHQCKVFLPSKGTTLTHASLLNEFTF